MTATQSSELLSYVFSQIDEEQRLTALHIGPALPETVDFFSNFRCKVHFADLFADLPVAVEENPELQFKEHFTRGLAIRPGTRFDICLFWDLFNYLDSAAITAFQSVLRPHLYPGSLCHLFSVHNLRSPQGDHLYGIRQPGQLNVRHRHAPLPGYAPHSQRELKSLLDSFEFERSVLLPDSRLELLLSARV